MLRRKKKRQDDSQGSEESSKSKLRKRCTASDSADEESERTLERIVFGGERELVENLSKDWDGGCFTSEKVSS